MRSRMLGGLATAMVARFGGHRIIRSIQRGTITLTSVASASATITAVDLSSSLLFLLGQSYSAAGGAWDDTHCRIELVNATTVTANRNNAPAATSIVSFEVVEFWPGVINTPQRRGLSIAGTSTTDTLSPAVNLSRASLIYLGESSNVASGSEHADAKTRLTLTDSTTVTATRGAAAGGTAAVKYMVWEWR